MFDMMVLAEITSKWAFSGMLSVTGIVCIIVVLLLYSKGTWTGSCSCLVFFIFAAIFTTDRSSSQNFQGQDMYVTNKSQTKWLKQSEVNLNEPGCIYIIFRHGTVSTLDDEQVYVPAKELYVDSDGWKVLRSTGKSATDADYYLLDNPIARANVSSAHGGMGVPQWLYHPGGLLWPFALGSLPALAGGMFIASKIRG